MRCSVSGIVLLAQFVLFGESGDTFPVTKGNVMPESPTPSSYEWSLETFYLVQAIVELFAN